MNRQPIELTNMSQPKQYKLVDLIQGLDASIQGDADCLISGVCTLTHAQPGQITFLTNPLYRKHLSETHASAVIVTAADAEECKTNAIITRNPHFVYAKIAQFFEPTSSLQPGIHSTAVIGEDCDIHPSAIIGANCVIGNRVTIKEQARIAAGTTIGDDCSIGTNTKLDARTTLYQNVKIGARSHICSGTVIGSDGFGFANEKGQWHRVPQLGGVTIGDDVSIGSNTTIDRGAVEDTIIENGVKLDNLIQVGHNVVIGENTIIAGCVAIAGSTTIGKNCMVGGATCFAGHINVCDGAMFTGMTAVTKSVTEPGLYSSGIVGVVPNHEFRKNNARFHRLENLMQRVKNLESQQKQQIRESKEV